MLVGDRQLPLRPPHAQLALHRAENLGDERLERHAFIEQGRRDDVGGGEVPVDERGEQRDARRRYVPRVDAVAHGVHFLWRRGRNQRMGGRR